MSMPPHEPSDESRRLVKALAAVGVRHEDIAGKLQICADTLTKYYRRELDDGRVDANAEIAKSLFQQAKSGNTTAMIFWLKTRAGWRESVVLAGDRDSPLTIQHRELPVSIDDFV